MLITPFLVWVFSEKIPYIRYALMVVGWYVVVKIAEYFDMAIFEILGFWSGHTLKHLLGAVTLVYVVKILQGGRLESNQP